jgi:hypothetical protein
MNKKIHLIPGRLNLKHTREVVNQDGYILGTLKPIKNRMQYVKNATEHDHGIAMLYHHIERISKKKEKKNE